MRRLFEALMEALALGVLGSAEYPVALEDEPLGARRVFEPWYGRA